MARGDSPRGGQGATSPSHTPRGRQPAPGMVPPRLSQPPWEVDPSVPVEGRLGRDLARYVLGGDGQTAFGQTCGCLAGIRFVNEPVNTSPSPGSELLLGSTPAPHVSCVLPREGKAWDRDATPLPSCSSLNRSKVLKLLEKSLGRAGGCKASPVPPRAGRGGSRKQVGPPPQGPEASPGTVFDGQAFISSKLDCASSSVQNSLECVWDKPAGASLQVRQSVTGPGSSRAILNSTCVTHGLDRRWLWKRWSPGPHVEPTSGERRTGTRTHAALRPGCVRCDRPSGPLNLLALLT